MAISSLARLRSGDNLRVAVPAFEMKYRCVLIEAVFPQITDKILIVSRNNDLLSSGHLDHQFGHGLLAWHVQILGRVVDEQQIQTVRSRFGEPDKDADGGSCDLPVR